MKAHFSCFAASIEIVDLLIDEYVENHGQASSQGNVRQKEVRVLGEDRHFPRRDSLRI